MGSTGRREAPGRQSRASSLVAPINPNVKRLTQPPRNRPMNQSLGLVSLVVRDYDEALAFFVGTLGFRLVEDTFVPEQSKRWVVVSPPGAVESRLLLARASTPDQKSRVGAQTGGRVFLFLYTDDFWRDYDAFQAKGVEFVREPKEEPYGTVAVFLDLYGNMWDLLQPTHSHLRLRNGGA